VLPIPTAVAVDPAVQAAREAQFGPTVAPVDAKMADVVNLLRLQDAVHGVKQQRVEESLRDQTNTRAWNADSRAQKYLDLQQQQEQRLEQQRKDDAAQSAASRASKGMQEAVSDADAYHSSVAATIPKIQNARSRDEYDAQILALKSLATGAAKRGLPVDQVSIPPFRGDVIADATKAYQANPDPAARKTIEARLRQMGIDPREAGIETAQPAAAPAW
jgi:hypothetical protein